MTFFLFYFISGLDFTLSTDKKNITIYGEREEVTQEVVQRSKFHTIYQTVIIEMGVNGIGESAFDGCLGLQLISIPSSVRYIKKNSFKTCSSLRYLNLPEGVNTIGLQAFYNSGIINITLPGTLTSIDSQSFLETKNLKYITCQYNELYSTMNNGSILVYRGTTIVATVFDIQTISIPEEIKILGEYAMNTRTSINSIVFEGTSKLHTIQRSCFRQTGITILDIPEGVTTLGSSIFDRSKLTKVIFPSSLTNVSDYVLQDAFNLNIVTGKNSSSIKFDENGVCYNGEMTMILFMPTDIKAFTITTGIKNILPATLISLTELAELKVVSNHSKYSVFNNTLYSNTNKTLYSVIGSATFITVHEACQSFSSSSLKNSKIYNITFLGNNFTTIDGMALEGTKKLRYIEFPESLTTIGTWTFYLSGILDISFPSKLSKFESHGMRMSSVVNVDFSRCTMLKEISSYMFESCKHLKTVILPEGLNSISTYVFGKCSIKTITIPSTLTVINLTAFKDSSLDTFIFPSNSTLSLIGDSSFSGTPLTSFSLPDSVTEIGTSAFEGCTNLATFSCNETSKLEIVNNLIFNGVSKLTNITFGANLAVVIPGAFTGCSSLISIDVCESNKNFSSHNGVLYSKDERTLIACPCGLASVTVLSNSSQIADSGFFNCSKITSITFEKGSQLTQIGSSTFYGCTNLASIVMPSGLQKLLDSCFSECEKLRTVEFETDCKVESIGKSAFSDCKALSEIDFSNCMYLEELESTSFSGCINLQKVTLSSSLKNLGSGCFSSCTALTEVIYCSRNIPEGITLWPTDVFKDSNEQLVVIVPFTYPFKTFCGAQISLQLDRDCNYATAVFTETYNELSSSLLMTLVMHADDE